MRIPQKEENKEEQWNTSLTVTLKRKIHCNYSKRKLKVSYKFGLLKQSPFFL